jgi:hypothetical protein
MTTKKRQRAARKSEAACSPCRRCGGKRTVTTYFDAGDHFSAGPAPNSGWRTYPCPECTANAPRQFPARSDGKLDADVGR